MLTTIKPGFYVGVDAGGTKTEAMIARESGFVIGRGIAGGANPHNMPLTQACSNITLAIKAAIEDVKVKNPEVQVTSFESACVGMAGFDTLEDRENIQKYISTVSRDEFIVMQANRVIITNDGLIGLRSGTDSNWGVCLIASTGSNCYGLSKGGKEFKAGDWGYILGDQASGFAMGKKILERVMKEYDGRRKKTQISVKVLDFLKMSSEEALLRWVYQQPVPVREIASLSQLANDNDLINDVNMSKIIDQSVGELMEAYEAVVDRAGFKPDEEIPVVLIGGLFAMKGHYIQKVEQSIVNLTPGVKIEYQTRAPAEGAVRVALMQETAHILPDTILQIFNPSRDPELTNPIQVETQI